jgi:CheY-like chemotaxis protein
MSKILIVDEKDKNREVIKEALLKIEKIDTNEENILEVTTGIDLIPTIKNDDNIDYIIINPYLKLLDGADAMEILLNQGFLAETRIIFLTEKALVHDIVTHKNVQDIIFKPDDANKLHDKLQSALFTKYELLSEKEQKLLLMKIDYQKKFIKNTIVSYLAENKKTQNIQESDFMHKIEECYDEFELLPKNDVLPLIEEIINSTCVTKDIGIHLDKNKIKFMFENQDEVDTKIESTMLSDQDNLKKLLTDKELTAQDKSTLNIELNKELERYIEILDEHKKYISNFPEFEHFAKIFSNKHTFNFHVFLLYIVLDTFKEVDNTLETNKLKLLIKDAKIMRRGVEILEYLRNNAKFYEFENESYLNFADVYDQDFDLYNKFINYQLALIIIEQIKKSDKLLDRFMTIEINTIKIGTIIDFFLHTKDCNGNEFFDSEQGKEVMESMRSIKVEYTKVKSTIVYLSQESLDNSESLKYIQKISDAKLSSYHLYHFSKNSVFDIWTNNKKTVDILIIDDNYELKQEKSVLDILNTHDSLFLTTKIILLTHPGRKSEEIKTFLNKASCFLKKPLDYEQTYKSILCI